MDEVDPLRRSELESEGKLWLQIAVTDETRPLNVRGTAEL
jgi:hypothetical protein